MTAALVTLAEHVCTRGGVTTPAWGTWWADADLAEDVTLSGAQVLTVADVQLSGTLMSGGPVHGRSTYRMVGGRGGWGKTLKRRAYPNETGVKVANVLRDAAAECGETITDLPSTVLGPNFVRPEGPAFAVLNLLAPQNWYVDFAGVTHVGKRPTTTFAGPGARTRIDLAKRVVEIAIEDEKISALVPGVVIADVKMTPATDVEYVFDASRLSVRVYGKAQTTRRLSALRRIFLALFPELRYLGHFEYRVVIQAGERFHLQPVRVASGMPDLLSVPVRPGVAHMRNQVQLGEQVLVVFADRDPSRPCITNHDAPDSAGFVGPAFGVNTLGDAVVAGPFGGITTTASAKVMATKV